MVARVLIYKLYQRPDTKDQIPKTRYLIPNLPKPYPYTKSALFQAFYIRKYC
jgi:hypothetical protein